MHCGGVHRSEPFFFDWSGSAQESLDDLLFDSAGPTTCLISNTIPEIPRWCPPHNDCGSHGALVGGGGGMGSCACRCADGFTGDRCRVTPQCTAPGAVCSALLAGLAKAYVIFGAPDSSFDGRYERMAAVWKTGRMRAMHQRLGSQGVSDRRYLH